MSRFSLNLRPRYGRDETTGGERIQQGISGALQDYLAYQESDRQERNAMATRGATPIASPRQGPMDRVRGIGGAIQRVLGRGNREGGERIPPTSIATDETSGIIDLGNGTGFNPNAATPAPFPLDPKPGSSVRGPTGPLAPSSSGSPGVPAAAPSSIGEALEPVILEGRGGQRYQMDPMREQKMALSGRRSQLELEDQFAQGAEARHRQAGLDEETRKRGVQEGDQQRQIDALVAGGMPAGEARARVLTGTVRYDETFGPQRPQTMTFEQRQILQRQRDEAAMKRAQLAASGKTNTDEYRRATLALQTANFYLSLASNQAAGFEREAAAAEKTVPTNPIDRQIAESTPGGKTRIAAAEATAGAARDSAGVVRNRGTQAAVDAVRGNGRTPEAAKNRALQLKNQGKSAVETYEIMKKEGYDVKPPTRR